MKNLNTDSELPSPDEVEALVCDSGFQAYCLGSDPDAQAYWERWLRDHPEKQSAFLQAQRIVEILSARQGNRQAELTRFKQGFRHAEAFREIFNDQKPVKGIRIWPAVAAVILAIGLGWGIYHYLPERNAPDTPILSSSGTDNAPAFPEYPLQYTTHGSGKRTIFLTDGSSVTLREGAVLTLLPGFGKTTRKVTLQGEAFFQVKHDPDKPFLVQTELLTTKVLGTEFNIENNASGHKTRVLLLKGKVEVALRKKPQEKVVLLPNQAYQTGDGISGKMQRLQAHEKDPEIQWVKTQFRIENMPLIDIAKRLEKAYGVRIVFEGELAKQYRYTGTFQTEGLLEALNALQLSYPFHYEIYGQTIRIHP